MAKAKEDTKTTDENVCKPLYKYEIGDEVFVMEDNKVKSFVIEKRIIVTRTDNDGKIRNEVLYDENNWNSLKAQYNENILYPSKKLLLETL